MRASWCWRYGADVRIFRRRQERHRSLALPYGVSLTTQVGQRQSRAARGAPRCREHRQLSLERQPRRVGVDAGFRRVAPEGIGLGEFQAPVCPVVIVGARPQPQQELLLGLVQHPAQV